MKTSLVLGLSKLVKFAAEVRINRNKHVNTS